MLPPADHRRIPAWDARGNRAQRPGAARAAKPDYDPSDRISAMSFVQQHDAKGEVVTACCTWTGAKIHAHPEHRNAPFNS
jgi:hypothetical protein